MTTRTHESSGPFIVNGSASTRTFNEVLIAAKRVAIIVKTSPRPGIAPHVTRAHHTEDFTDDTLKRILYGMPVHALNLTCCDFVTDNTCKMIADACGAMRSQHPGDPNILYRVDIINCVRVTAIGIRYFARAERAPRLYTLSACMGVTDGAIEELVQHQLPRARAMRSTLQIHATSTSVTKATVDKLTAAHPEHLLILFTSLEMLMPART
jgi:hypothetical protein